jgi:glycosyltransferase involved in cell wall biosynthesis
MSSNTSSTAPLFLPAVLPADAARVRPAPFNERPPVRVAHLIHTMAHGGVETALLNWTETFDRSRVEPHLFCFANPGATEAPFIDAATRRGLPVTTIPWSRLKPVWRASRVMADWVRRLDIDILHCHNAYADMVGALTARATGVRTLTTIYVWSDFGLKRRLLQWIDLRVIRRFDRVTAHCEAARVKTVARGFAAHQIPVLPCGFADRVAHLHATERERLRSAAGVRPGETVLIKVARFWPEKRHDVLLHGFRALLALDPNVRLWLPGVGPEQSQVQALANELGLGDRVSFLGFRTDLPELLAQADIQVHTSDEEGVPLAILSGMAAAKPIVATRVGGLEEVIRHDHSGILIPPREPELFARTVLELIADPARQRRLGMTAGAFIADEYSLRAATSRVERLYAELVGR